MDYRTSQESHRKHGRPKLIYHKNVRAILSAIIIVGMGLLIGCDERNEPELPAIVYTLKKNIVTPGVALSVDAEENLLAVAASSAGTFVYDITNVSVPVEMFHYEPPGRLFSSEVEVDAINGLVVTSSGPLSEAGDKYPVHVIETGQRIGGLAFTSPEEMELRSFEGILNVWRTDNSDGLAFDSYCYNADSARWRPDYCTDFYVGIPNASYRLRGFGIRDTLVAVAQANFEIRLHNISSGLINTRFSTTGDPQDVAWYGDFLLVADNVHFTVVNVANLDSPSVVKTLTIPGADRLQRVVTEGNYAILLDDADGLYVVDVSTPTDPKHVQTISLPEVSSVTAANGRVIASDEQLGVLIYER